MCDFGFPPIPLNRSFLDILYLSDFLDSLYLVRQEVGSVRSESGILTRAGAAPREPHQLAGTRGILTIIFLPPTTRYSCRLSEHNTQSFLQFLKSCQRPNHQPAAWWMAPPLPPLDWLQTFLSTQYFQVLHAFKMTLQLWSYGMSSFGSIFESIWSLILLVLDTGLPIAHYATVIAS